VKIVVFGAGNIGRGFLGQLFHDAGWEVVFVEANPALTETLREHRTYPVRLVDNRSDHTVWVGPVRCVGTQDRGIVLNELEDADLAATAVGPAKVRELAPVLAEGARRRDRPLDVILAENLWNAAWAMRDAATGAGFRDAIGLLGWVESSIGRMVPARSPREGEHPLLVVAEPYAELPVDAGGFLGPVPSLPTLRPVAPFEGYVARKLFVHNAGHACAAYLGAEKGHETIWGAVEDPEIRPVVEGAMRESAEAIHRRYGLDRLGLDRHVEDLLEQVLEPASARHGPARRGQPDSEARCERAVLRRHPPVPRGGRRAAEPRPRGPRRLPVPERGRSGLRQNRGSGRQRRPACGVVADLRGPAG
jgi:mannitol-1-phosphate 5-dehydrogenase